MSRAFIHLNMQSGTHQERYEVGDRVMTPDGPGAVSHYRFGPPDYTQVIAYSVRLDAKKSDYNYAGSMYPADKVKPLEEADLTLELCHRARG